jgi:hypothetical protein
MSTGSYKVELKPDDAMVESRSALSAILLLGADPVPQEAGLLFPKYMSEENRLSGTKPAQAAAVHDPAAERPADDPLRHQRAVDQRIMVDSCRNAHLVRHKDDVFGAHIAGGSAVGVPCKRTTAEPGDRTVEQVAPMRNAA